MSQIPIITIVDKKERIELVIIEDDHDHAERYKAALQKMDSKDEYIENISIFNNDIDFLKECGKPSVNKIYIVDLILDSGDMDTGTEKGLNVLNHILSCGKNHIFIRSANIYRREFREIFQKRPDIVLSDRKDEPGKVFYTKVFKTIQEYYDLLNNERAVDVWVEDILDSNAETLIKSSIQKTFYECYVKERNYVDMLFIAKCFLWGSWGSAQLERAIWQCGHAAWLIRKEYHESETLKRNSFLNIIFSGPDNRISRIVFPELDIIVRFNGLGDTDLIIETFPEVTSLERWIIRYFIISRCVDLYISDKISVPDIFDIFYLGEIFGDAKDFYEKAFIFSLWEKLMHKSGRNAKLVEIWLSQLYKFPIVQDIFYCRINDEPSDNSDFVSTEVKSVDRPDTVFLMEYSKSYIGCIKPFFKSKPFRLIYFQRPGNTNENSCIVENILLEEFLFLGKPLS